MTSAVSGMVSVLMPVYNGAPYLRKSVESVLTQTYSNIELVAVDDGSPDDSVTLLEQFEDPRIRVFRQNNCGNVGAVRNACMDRARGEYFAFLDQDDWWLPGKLASQVRAAEQSRRIGLVHTGVLHFYEALREFGPPVNPLMKREEASGLCYETLLMGNVICNSSVLVRRSAIDEVGQCDLRIAGNTVQDYDMWLRIAHRFELVFVPDQLTVYYIHPNQGLWNRITMLLAELDLLTARQTPEWWLATAFRRRRLAGTHNELAVAYLDQYEMSNARRHFGVAHAVAPSVRSGIRSWASRLPPQLIRLFRGDSRSIASPGTLAGTKCTST